MKKLLIPALLIFIATSTFATPKYIIIQQRWGWGWKLKHVDKPTKKLNRWCYDAETDTYYRIRSAFGFGMTIKNNKK